MRSHASWGSQNDVYIAFMNQETMDRFLLSKEELELLQAEEKLAADKKKGKDKSSEKDKSTDKEAVFIDLERLSERVMRLTPMSSRIASAALTSDGETLYFLSAFEGGYDLWKKETRSGNVNMVKKLNASLPPCCWIKEEKTFTF